MRKLAFALPLLTLALATPGLASHSWGNYHWARTTTAFTLQLLNNMSTAKWSGILSLASADESKSSVLHTNIMNGTGGTNCKAKAGTIQVCNRKCGFNGWLGLAQIWISGDHITQATAKVNDSARRHVLCQEIGHTFGLGHQNISGNNSCMDDVNGLFDPAAVSPDAHDYEQLATIYGSHTDSTGIASPKPTAAAFDEECPDVPRNFGRPVGTGRVPEVLFVHEFPDGRKLFTWVVPAPPGNPDAP